MPTQSTTVNIIGKGHGSQLPALIDVCADMKDAQAELVAILKPWLSHQREDIKAQFFRQHHPDTTIRQLSDMVDNIIHFVARYTQAHAKQHGFVMDDHMSWVALGGYGRRRLFPFSDIDIMCLHASASEEVITEMASLMLYVLWDLGFQVGHAVRTPLQCEVAAKEDHTVLTAFLDARLIGGDADLFEQLRAAALRARDAWSEGQFIDAKLKERDKRHEKSGDSRYILEPNVKEGKGALRDMHTLYWLARYTYGIDRVRDLVPQGRLTDVEYRSYRRAQHFLWVVRIYLHYFSNRAEERLTFDMQRRIAEAMGYRGHTSNQAVERFMKRYFQVARDNGMLTGLFCATLEEEQRRAPRMFLAGLLDKFRRHEHIVLQSGRLSFRDMENVQTQPSLMMKLFYVFCMEGLPLHPKALQAITRSLPATRHNFRHHSDVIFWFLSILMHPQRGYATLRMMNDTGLLAKFFPDFAHVVGQMQFDMYHIYTVDEHTLTAIGILHAIERGELKHELPLSHKMMPLITSKRVLYVAMLCHDIAKGRGGDHEVKGIPIGRKLARQLGSSQAEIETVGWLIEHQSLLSDAVFKRDLHDPATIHYFGQEVQTVDRLRLLLLLTVADIRAVGPKVWNGWKGGLIRDLYHLCAEYLRTGSLETNTNQMSALKEQLQTTLVDWKEVDRDYYLWRGHTSFFSSRDALGHAVVARLLRVAEELGRHVVMDIRSDVFLDATELTVCTPDRKGLMADVAAAISLSHLNIVNANIFTLKDGWAVQTWHIQGQDNHAVEEEHHALLLNNVEDVVEGKIDAPRLLAHSRVAYPSKRDHFNVPTQVSFENNESPSYSIIEISTADRIGLLHTICRCLQMQGLNISSAHINTYGEKAVDVFYVRDAYGMKIAHPKRMEQIQEALYHVMNTGYLVR